MPVAFEISDAVIDPLLSASSTLALFCPRGARPDALVRARAPVERSVAAVRGAAGRPPRPDVHAGVGQRIGVGGRAHEIRLHAGSKPIGQAACGDGEDAGLDGVGESGLFRADLHTPAYRQRVRNGREAVGGRRRAGARAARVSVARWPYRSSAPPLAPAHVRLVQERV
jgi:hypothetical protein